MKSEKRIVLGQPIVIAQSEPLLKENDNWGPYQFPEIERLSDGRLHATYHIRKDSALAYGKSKGHAISSDDGATWAPMQDSPINRGILLKNGDRLSQKMLPAVDISSVELPGDVDDEIISYRICHTIYDAKRFPSEFNRWPIERLRAGETDWTVEMKEIEIPKVARYYNSEGVFPYYTFWRMRQAPSGRIWGISYPFFYTGIKPTRVHPLFCVSDDNGHTFSYLSDIPYTPDPERDPLCERRGGFSEPDVTFMPDGSVLCLLRTTDGHGIGPSYKCHSRDGGVTWTKPEVFDDNGVWPTLLTLKNGTTLAAYGRPGLFLRATSDPAGKIWDERVDIVPKGEYQTDTCSYADLMALDDNTAYLIYSDFKYPNKDGIPVKTVLGRRIEIARY